MEDGRGSKRNVGGDEGVLRVMVMKNGDEELGLDEALCQEW